MKKVKSNYTIYKNVIIYECNHCNYITMKLLTIKKHLLVCHCINIFTEKGRTK